MGKCNRCSINEIKGLERFCIDCKKLNKSEAEQRYRDKNKIKREAERRKEFEENFNLVDPSDKYLTPKGFNSISKLSSSSYRKHFKMNWAEVLDFFNKRLDYEKYIKVNYKNFYVETGSQDMVLFAKSIGLTYPLLQEIDIEQIRNSIGIETARNKDEDYEANFLMIKNNLGKIPLYIEFMDNSLIGIGTYAKKFNLSGKVYDEIVKMYSTDDEFAQYKKEQQNHKSNTGRENHQGERYTLEELEVEFKRVYDEHILIHDNVPSRRMFNELSKFDDSLYRHRLKMTFSEIVESYGYEVDYSNTKSERMVVGMFASILNSEPITQARFDWLKSIKNYSLRCDSYFPEFKLIMEFDGIQHTKAIDYWGGEEGLRIIQANDAIKNKLIPEHNLTLIRIAYNDPYWDEDFLRMRLIENNIVPPNYKLVEDSAMMLSL